MFVNGRWRPVCWRCRTRVKAVRRYLERVYGRCVGLSYEFAVRERHGKLDTITRVSEATEALRPITGELFK